MRTSIDRTLWYDNILAAFIFFTRLPFWKLRQPPKESYRRVVEYWPLTGWLTGAAMGGTIFGLSFLMPYHMAVIAGIVVRLLLTGALHEDGLADFIDGFGGGGSDRRRILDIMKDSRIGTYGVIGLVVYLALLFSALYAMQPMQAMITVMAADPFAKMVAGQIILMMPYARSEEEAKAGVVYRKFGVAAGIGLAVQGLLPLALLFCYGVYAGHWQTLVFVPCIVMYALYRLVWARLRGYTGDCCGAIFLLVELAFYITSII